ncbi:glycosyltransferase, partial [Mesorhizobium sp. M7A.T.Ca.TU.009.02.1.1]
MSMTKSEVCVIIAAKNAAATIAVAIASALREPEVAEVVVVDDASTD